MADSGEVIILSDDDDDCDDDLSCLILEEEEEVKKADCALSQSCLDEDLVVTYSRSAEVLPHARYDCPIHPFMATDRETASPVASNQLICDQCFCYICDKLASSCVVWTCSGVCHCNSHKRSGFWSNIRNNLLLGGLAAFNLTLLEIDSHLRQAEAMLQSFRQELSVKFISFTKGRTLQEYGVTQENVQGLIYDYTPVYEFVSSFLNKADKQDSRAAAVLNLGAAEDFIRHFQVSGNFILQSPIADPAQAKILLLQRVIASVQRLMLTMDFTPEFINKLQNFYKKLHFPSDLKNMRNSLFVRPWNDVLLVSVLKGQNVSGVRKERKKKDVLTESFTVILHRMDLLQRQRRYRELCRYLRVVQTDASKLLQQVQDLIPYFMCLEGDFTSALTCLFPSVRAPASHLSPRHFVFYLRIFTTATAPRLVVTQPAQLCLSNVAWEPVKDAVPLKSTELVRFALKVQRNCPAVYADSHCWACLLAIVNVPCSLPAPSPHFLQEALDVVNAVLLGEHSANLLIPRSFQEAYPDQALLLLVTGALRLRILSGPLSPVLPVLNTFKENVWAFKWLCDGLSSSKERHDSFAEEIKREVENAGGENVFPYILPAPSEDCEQRSPGYQA
ncbi:uncharacterized protein zgc:112980 [Mugil cephalus]|uniref:uncharacterized protein zgc:112980 n=1 Tax=Mugil cephalus TaxID=48193 RepID=UPI001FB68E04|nr:uncharacterized protein zgc:112980 [Mugil cephalus]